MRGLLPTALLVLICVGVHYEALALLSRRLPQFLHVRPRARVALGIVGALLAHAVEVALFAVGTALLLELGLGELNPPARGFPDVLYFSFVSYTSLGFGDIVPLGPLRLLAGVEALTGLVMIAWTASFTYVQMERFWGGAA